MSLPLSIKTPSGQPLLFSKGLPEALSEYRIYGTKPHYTISDNDDLILYQQIVNNKFTAWISHFLITRPTSFLIKARVNDLLLHYTIQGTMFYVIDRQESTTTNHQLNILISKRLNHPIRFKTQGLYVALNVHIPYTELEELNNNFPAIRQFMEQIISGNAVTLLEHNLVADERLRNIVQDITERQLQNSAREKYCEQKITELIIESLNAFSLDITSNNGLSPLDNAKIENTEALLLAHLQHSTPPTLKQLARSAGTNEKKLETIFKMKHHMTIYDYFLHARMQMIYRKLTETDIPLRRIANQFGYKDYSSFSFAVKRSLGENPKDIRKKNKG